MRDVWVLLEERDHEGAELRGVFERYRDLVPAARTVKPVLSSVLAAYKCKPGELLGCAPWTGVAVPRKPLNVPQAAERLRAYYALEQPVGYRWSRPMGGVVHVITEDANSDQPMADGCLDEAEQHGDEDDVAIAFMLAEMTATQRLKLCRAYSFYPE
ncbi:MAG TPA: hypothetical protein VMP89_05905 [Solirubrobacteraceae bacterium]|nr:hypothetical protein [Solirubrobacteraceae bacterium]